MYSAQFSKLLIVALSLSSVTQASFWDLGRRDGTGLIARQLGGDDLLGSKTSASQGAATPKPGTTSSVQETSSTSKVEETTSSSATPTPKTTSSSTPVAETSSTSSTPAPSPEATTSSSVPPKTSSAPPQQTTTSKDSDKPATSAETPVVSTSFAVVTKTLDNGEKSTMTTAVKTTTTPNLNTNKDNQSSGMSPKTRNTVIGVVVGVGGAIVLGALGLVAWRIWGRKRQAEENDGLMAYDGGYTGIEKSEQGSSHGPTNPAQRNPFQSTLENYHQPTPVNTSSNF